ncbi:recombinase family protein [Bacillus mycoides]|uniref:recombinase family protein n=1 Tax=Bacillus mycoides TaxID=1405 RepID=UPI0011AA3659|nr:recombinase family protein [Bacillus mycoides]
MIPKSNEKMTKTNTVAIYVRVSTEEQAREGYSIPAQKERLEAYCKSQGWNDYKFFVDEGTSARSMERPQLKMVLNDVKKGKIQLILVYRLDRFTRRVKDLHEMLEFMDKYKCGFKSATEAYDTTTATGRLFITLVAAIAEWESDNSAERIKMALEEKVSGGERVGAVPYGFYLDENEKLVKNEKAAIVKDMIEKVWNGMSASQLAFYLNKVNNDRNWHPNGVLRVLRNPALYGATRWNDKVYDNTHEGLITKSEFNKLQELLESRTIYHKRDVSSIYLFQGVIACNVCDKPLSVNRFLRKRKDGTPTQGCVYKCQACWKKGNKMLSIGENRFENALKEFFKHVIFSCTEPIEVNNDLELYMSQLKQVEKTREKYQRAWGADRMTDDEFYKLMDETKEVYVELKRKIDEIESTETVDPEAIKKIVNTFNANFKKLLQEEKRAFISRFIKRIEFKLIEQPPQRPEKNKRGKSLVEITNVHFY